MMVNIMFIEGFLLGTICSVYDPVDSPLVPALLLAGFLTIKVARILLRDPEE